MPHVVTKCTYMADVDIFLTESVLDPKRFKQMSFHNIPHSNIIHINTTMLTGVMLADTEKKLYPDPDQCPEQTRSIW